MNYTEEVHYVLKSSILTLANLSTLWCLITLCRFCGTDYVIICRNKASSNNLGQLLFIPKSLFLYKQSCEFYWDYFHSHTRCRPYVVAPHRRRTNGLKYCFHSGNFHWKMMVDGIRKCIFHTLKKIFWYSLHTCCLQTW